VALFSKPTARALAILDFMAAHPDRAFGLSDLSRRLQLNKTTCLSILTTLTHSGFLLQDPESRAYRLGPSLAAAGAAAAAQFPALQEIRDEVMALCATLNVGGVAMARAQDQVVVLARLSHPDPVNDLVQPGLRVPFAAPFGCALIAWSTRSQLDEWFERARAEDGASRRLDRAHRERTLHSIALIRSRGFEVTLHTTAERNLYDALRTLRRQPDASGLKALARNFAVELRRERYHLDDIRRDQRYPVSTIAAPVFDTRPHPELQLLIGGFRWETSGSELLAAADRLLGLARRVSEASGGRFPDSRPATRG
jgi:DNA-binding IclR family transcriptional regulator